MSRTYLFPWENRMGPNPNGPLNKLLESSYDRYSGFFRGPVSSVGPFRWEISWDSWGAFLSTVAWGQTGQQFSSRLCCRCACWLDGWSTWGWCDFCWVIFLRSKWLPTPKMNECPLKRDHFEKKGSLPTINFWGVMLVFRGVPHVFSFNEVYKCYLMFLIGSMYGMFIRI